MVAMPKETNQQEIDKYTREAILSIKSGTVPDSCNDTADFSIDGPFGKWGDIVQQIKRYRTKCKGDLEKTASYIDTRCKDNPPLTKLLADPKQKGSVRDTAREYILSLKAGNPPVYKKNWSDFGSWGPLVSEIDRMRGECTGSQIEIAQKMAEKIENHCTFNPTLRDLLTEDHEEVKNEAPPINFSLPSVNLSNSDFVKVRTQFLDFAKELSPESYDWFLEGAFWWTCSSIAMRRIVINFTDPMYTNLYIALCAKSSVWKKSTALKSAERILKGLGLLHIRHKGSETPEAFIQQASGNTIPRNWDELDKAEQEAIHKELATAGVEGLFIDELGQYLLGTRNTNGPMGLWRRIILEWYECQEDWRKKTKGGGWEIVEKTYLSIFGCIVPDNLNEKDMEALKKDGTIARFLAIAPPSNTSAEVHSFELGYLQTPPELLKAFSEWHQRLNPPMVEVIEEPTEDDKGKKTTKHTVHWIQPLEETTISLTPEAHKTWHNYRVAIRKCRAEYELSSTFAAYYDRLGDSLIKMAALAASFEDKQLIDLTHIAMAFPFIEEARQGIHRLISQAGGNQESADVDSRPMLEDKIMEYMEEMREQGKEWVTQRQIMRKTHKKADEVKIALEVLKKDGEIQKRTEKESEQFRINTD